MSATFALQLRVQFDDVSCVVAMPRDAGSPDAGAFDTGPPDAGPPDAGVPVDAGPQPNGATCTGPGGCTSRFCVDGVCCNERCDGVCMACIASLSRTPDGTCSAFQEDTDPGDTECPGPPRCQDADGLPPFTAYCRAHFGDACTGVGAVPSCPTGGGSGFFCSEGVCCDRVCGETASALECHSCRGATRGGGTDGMCLPVMMGLDPFDECPSTRVCGSAGVCLP